MGADNEDDNVSPWETLSSHIVYENPWIKVHEHQVINPAGNEGIYGVVSMKNLAVGIIPVDENDMTWLVGQYRYPLNEYSWEIIEGGCPVGTDLVETAKRELKEEAGLEAEHFEVLMRLSTSNSVTDELGYIYLAHGISQGESSPEETELLKIKHLSVDEAIEMAMQGKIHDSLSLCGLLKLASLRQKKQ
jgi:8-oxo-dGTP pyrophosphatase MutT (NUDIX family)